MTRLDVMGNTEVVEEVLKAIFEANPKLPFQFDGRLPFFVSVPSLNSDLTGHACFFRDLLEKSHSG